jgi:photosystem II stability/assembly factor-like uncharacterized protein
LDLVRADISLVGRQNWQPLLERYMKKVLIIGVVLLFSGGIFFGWETIGRVGASIMDLIHDDPDYPRWMQSSVSKEEFMHLRSEGIAMKRGLSKGQPFDPLMRVEGIKTLEKQENLRLDMAPSNAKDAVLNAWIPIGPNPIPNGQVNSGPSTPASGRVISIAVHPTDPDIAYVGTAQGGLYRTTNGGQSWTPLMDNALSLAVNAIAFVPGQPETIFVGTGEAGFCADCFFGVGIYRIDNASTSADLSGPFATPQFSGRSVSKIVFHPTDPNIMFVTSANGVGGIGAVSSNALAARGVFRSTDALSPAPSFTKLTVAGLAGQDRPFVDMVMDPGNPDVLLITEVDSFALGEGGVYRSTNAVSAPNPTFVRTLPIAGTGSTNTRTELAIHRNPEGNVTVYAASARDGGTLHRSLDGGATWEQRIDNNFCTPQCFYDIAVAVDPTNADRVFLGGSPNLVFGRSDNGGTTFTPNGVNFTSGLHVDTHAIAVAPSNPSIVYFGSDGGIYRTNDVQATPIVWTPLNNTTFSATQFMSLAVHPTDPNYTIGGTQDNGTNMYLPNATWLRINGGDGGFTVVDQNATDTVNVTMYHTFFNQTNAMGYARATVAGGPFTTFGCGFNGFTANGMTCAATATLFYAPLESGPGNPNTLYFGSDVLYRSSDLGVTMQKVSQEPIQNAVAISAIGIAPQNDNVRIVGLRTGGLFGTTTGSSTLTDLDPLNHVPNGYVARAAVDPLNVDRAYVTLSFFGQPSVWKTENLSSPTPMWTAAAIGLPQIPVSAFIIDPLDPNMLYAGTDIGVYSSSDGGASWVPLGTGLPRIAVFDIAIANGTPRKLRIATHGRGLWEYSLPAASPFASVIGRVLSANMRGLANARVSITDSANEKRTIFTNGLGFFTFGQVPTGASYSMAVTSKRFRFSPRNIDVGADLTVSDFVGIE